MFQFKANAVQIALLDIKSLMVIAQWMSRFRGGHFYS